MIVSFFYLLVGLLGVITTSIILTQHKSNRIINLYLLLLFILISVKFLFDGIFYFNEGLKPNFSYRPFFTITFPLLYLYFKNLVENTKKYKSSELYHFIFPIALGGINVLNNNYGILGSHALLILHTLFLLFTLFYFSVSLYLLKTKIWQRESKIKVINQQNELLRQWTLFLFVIFGLIIIRLLTSIFFDVWQNDITVGLNYQWISGILWFLLYLKLLCSPEILFGYNALYKKINIQNKTRLSMHEIWIVAAPKAIHNRQDFVLNEKINPMVTSYMAALEELVFVEKCFRNPKNTTAEIARKLSIPNSHLHFVFKYHAKISFTEFKKICKIYDALELIEKDYLKTNTLEALALKVGFSSYNPFFTSFKEVTGLSPQAHAKETSAPSKVY